MIPLDQGNVSQQFSSFEFSNFDLTDLGKWNLKSQSAPVNFTFVPLDQSYPVCKRKKENLDLYLPDGALKINWMVKQLEQIPAVLCFFVDLEFNDPNMGNRLQEIKSKLDILRQSLENRNRSK